MNEIHRKCFEAIDEIAKSAKNHMIQMFWIGIALGLFLGATLGVMLTLFLVNKN